MEELVIQNFKFGLDARRSELTSVPGTLVTLENAHVNEGAEVEKRYGFFQLLPAAFLNLDAWLAVQPGNTLVTFNTAYGPLALGGSMQIAGYGMPTIDSGGKAFTDMNNSLVAASSGLTVVTANYSGLRYALGAVWGTALSFGNWSNQPITAVYGFANRVWYGGRNPDTVNGSPCLRFSTLPATNANWDGGSGDSGSGFLDIGGNDTVFSDIMALVQYQGLLAVINRFSVQTWYVTGGSSGFYIVQPLPNIGTLARRSVQAIGDLDVFMAHDSGVRSLRVRDSSKNAFVVDLGSAVDAIVKPLLSALTPTQLDSVCSGVEINTNRYWLYIPTKASFTGFDGTTNPGTIFVFSYFPTLKILAWSTYVPSYFPWPVVLPGAYAYVAGSMTYTGLTIGNTYWWFAGPNEVSATCNAVPLVSGQSFVAGATTVVVTGSGTNPFTGFLRSGNPSANVSYFKPLVMVNCGGRVIIRADVGTGVDMLFGYGFRGDADNQYDATVATVELPYLDAKRPSQEKVAQGIDIAASNGWKVYAGMAPTIQDAAALVTQGPIYTTQTPQGTTRQDSTFDIGTIPFSATGTHFKFLAKSTGSGPATLSSLVFKFNWGTRK